MPRCHCIGLRAGLLVVADLARLLMPGYPQIPDFAVLDLDSDLAAPLLQAGLRDKVGHLGELPVTPLQALIPDRRKRGTERRPEWDHPAPINPRLRQYRTEAVR